MKVSRPQFGGEQFFPAAGMDSQFVTDILNYQRKSGFHTYDVAVIGSGHGGGHLALKLMESGVDTVLVEQGDLTPGQDFFDYERRLSKDGPIGTLYEASSRMPLRPAGCGYVGGEIHVFGGKGLFWGGLAVEPNGWEIDCFQPEAASYLRSPAAYYDAGKLMDVQYSSSPLQEATIELLRQLHPTWRHEGAGYAVRRRGLRLTGLTAMHNPAEAILSKMIWQGLSRRVPLSVYLNQKVEKVHPCGRRPAVIEAVDTRTGSVREFRARNVVLAAGAIGTPAIALRSGLHPAAGVGLTDHPILYTRFVIPKGAPLHDITSTAKIVTQAGDARPDRRRWNLLVELNTGQHERRYSHVNGLTSRPECLGRRRSEREMVSELVFILHAPLCAANRVSIDADTGWPHVSIEAAPVSSEEIAEMQAVAYRVIKSFRGRPLEGEGRLVTAATGCVAHEVGSMSSTIDGNWRLLGHENIYVCDLSAFNVAPAANPTLTLVALSMKLAKQLTAKLGKL